MTVGRTLIIAGLVSYCGAAVLSAQPGRSTWTVPPAAKAEKNVLTMSDAVLVAGKQLYEATCSRCHGKSGRGDGPDADVKQKANMDLTTAAGAANNTDGAVFYKVWNGRETPLMPGLKGKASQEQAWAIVAYTQTLRKK